MQKFSFVFRKLYRKNEYEANNEKTKRNFAKKIREKYFGENFAKIIFYSEFFRETD